jgi:hypothetical protein
LTMPAASRSNACCRQPTECMTNGTSIAFAANLTCQCVFKFLKMVKRHLVPFAPGVGQEKSPCSPVVSIGQRNHPILSHQRFEVGSNRGRVEGENLGEIDCSWRAGLSYCRKQQALLRSQSCRAQRRIDPARNHAGGPLEDKAQVIGKRPIDYFVFARSSIARYGS